MDKFSMDPSGVWWHYHPRAVPEPQTRQARGARLGHAGNLEQK